MDFWGHRLDSAQVKKGSKQLLLVLWALNPHF
jgi:hypothetical protein